MDLGRQRNGLLGGTPCGEGDLWRQSAGSSMFVRIKAWQHGAPCLKSTQLLLRLLASPWQSIARPTASDAARLPPADSARKGTSKLRLGFLREATTCGNPTVEAHS
jgi:hypothetical protein